MNKPMRILRSVLFMPVGDPVQQDHDVRQMETSLRIGQARIQAARNELDESAKLKTLFNEVLEKIRK